MNGEQSLISILEESLAEIKLYRKEITSENQITIAEGFVQLGNISVASLLFGQFFNKDFSYELAAFGSVVCILFYLGAILTMKWK